MFHQSDGSGRFESSHILLPDRPNERHGVFHVRDRLARLFTGPFLVRHARQDVADDMKELAFSATLRFHENGHVVRLYVLFCGHRKRLWRAAPCKSSQTSDVVNSQQSDPLNVFRRRSSRNKSMLRRAMMGWHSTGHRYCCSRLLTNSWTLPDISPVLDRLERLTFYATCPSNVVNEAGEQTNAGRAIRSGRDRWSVKRYIVSGDRVLCPTGGPPHWDRSIWFSYGGWMTLAPLADACRNSRPHAGYEDRQRYFTHKADKVFRAGHRWSYIAFTSMHRGSPA
nr:hypothetical protein CFP56_11807 [Quercus suber]